MDKTDEPLNDETGTSVQQLESHTHRRGELIAFIRYQLSKMRSRNEHHRFEDLCRSFSRQRITKNVIPATGPVSAGGDQGRDFETFSSYLKNNVQSLGVFLGAEEGNGIVFCCSLQQSTVASKVIKDVEVVCGNEDLVAVDAIVYFVEADVPVSQRHKLTKRVMRDFSVRLSIIDGSALAELLSEPENIWIAVEYLNVSLDLLSGSDLAMTTRELFLTGDIIVRPPSQLDPVRDLGVHAAMQLDEWSGLPEYVSRSIDSKLDSMLDGGGLVVIEGGSATGKTRAAYEAMMRSAARTGERPVVIPKDGQSLRKLISAGYDLESSIIWLDDLEKFIGAEGVDEGIVRLFALNGNVLFLATLRSRAKVALQSSIAGPSGRSLSKISDTVLSSAQTLRVAKNLNADELTSATNGVADPRILAAISSENSGFAEYMAAAPATLSRWMDGKDGANEVGSAIVSAAVDLRRAGYFSPISRAWLEGMYAEYLDPRMRGRTGKTQLETAFSWATEIVSGASSCLEILGEGFFSPFDYLVDFAQRKEVAKGEEYDGRRYLQDIPDFIWHGLAERVQVDDPSFMSCVSTSALSNHPGLKWFYDKAVTDGSITGESLKDRGILLNFVRACAVSHMCIVCQASVHKLDISAILGALLDECGPVLSDPNRSPTRSQVESVQALASMGEDANLRDADAPLHLAALQTTPEKWVQLGQFMMSVGLNAGRYWICFAQLQEGEVPDWPVSLTKARAIRIPGDRSAPSSRK